MSIEYRDGSFSENMPMSDAMKKLTEALDDGTARALHVGTEPELDRIKRRKALHEEIEELKSRIEVMEAGPVESEVIHIPTRDEIIQTLRDANNVSQKD